MICKQLSLTCASLTTLARPTSVHIPHKRLCRSSRALVALATKDQQAETADTLLDVAVSQALTAIGLSGTVAVAGAALCGINLSSLFHWERLQDLQLALLLNTPILLLDALLFVPSYSIPEQLLEPQTQQQEQEQQQQKQQQQQQRFLDVSSVAGCSAWSPSSWRLMLAMLEVAMRGPQVQQLPLQVSAGLLVAREASKELLQRGLVLTALAGWLTDRLYEADAGGLQGLVTLPGGVQAPVPEVGLLAASLAATVLFSPAAFLAAEEAAAGVGAAMLLRTEAGAAVAAAKATKKGGRSSSSPAVSTQAAAVGEGTSSQAPAAAGAEAEQAEDEHPDPEVLEYRMVKVSQACFSSAPPQLAYRITLAKSLGRLMLANVVFVASQQNLAASLTGGLALNVLLLAYSRALGQPGQGSAQSSRQQ